MPSVSFSTPEGLLPRDENFRRGRYPATVVDDDSPTAGEASALDASGGCSGWLPVARRQRGRGRRAVLLVEESQEAHKGHPISDPGVPGSVVKSSSFWHGSQALTGRPGDRDCVGVEARALKRLKRAGDSNRRRDATLGISAAELEARLSPHASRCLGPRFESRASGGPLTWSIVSLLVFILHGLADNGDGTRGEMG
jgi:hypothetical protein